MNKIDLLNNYSGTLICCYLFNISLELKNSCARDTTNCYNIFTTVKVSIRNEIEHNIHTYIKAIRL